jgi:hypothetical protein
VSGQGARMRSHAPFIFMRDVSEKRHFTNAGGAICLFSSSIIRLNEWNGRRVDRC